MNALSVAHDITYLLEKRLDIFCALTLAEQSTVFEHLSPHVRQDIISKLKDSQLVNLLDEMDLRRAESIIATMKNHRRRRKIISRLKNELKEKTEYFLRFHPKAAISLVNFNYIMLEDTTDIGETADKIENHYRETGKLPEIIVHHNGALIGEIPYATLIRENNRSQIRKFIVPIKTVTYQSDIQEIIDTFNTTKKGKVAVLDKDGSVIGIIYSEDALKLFGNGVASVLYDFAGVSESEKSFDSIKNKVKHRYKWLLINLATAFLAAFIVGLFKDTLSQIVVLAVYMPIIAGMGGNAATQTLAVIVRGITVGEISLKNGMPAVIREVGAGLLNGLINGIIVALIVIIFNGDPLLGLVFAIAMVINLVVAGFFGALVPLVMKAMGKDPATSATIFISTATDVFGFLAFLGLATLILL